MTQDEVLSEDEDSGPAESGDEKSEGQEEEQGSELEGRYRLPPLSLSVFRREHDGNVFFDLSLQLVYPVDDEGEDFDYTSNLRPRDLRKASRLLEWAADDIQGLEKKDNGNGGGERR